MVAMQGKLLREVQEMHVALNLASKGSSPPPPPALLESWCSKQQKQAILVSTSRSDAAAKTYRYHSRLLGLTVAASFSLTRGAGGFSIAPCLSINFPVSKNSPAFYRMYTYTFVAKDQDPAAFVDDTIELLKYLFTERQATPSDTTSDGESLVHAACFAFWQASKWHANAYTHFSRLILFLLHGGATLDRSRLRQTGLDTLLAAFPLDKDEHGLLRLLIQQGGFLTVDGAFFGPLSLPNMRRALELDEGAVHIPEIAKSIIQQSEKHLRHEIQSGASVNERIGASTLLQLSISWSKGVQILLEAGADVHALCNRFPLEMAIRANHYESAKLLLRAGCPLDLAYISLSEHLEDEGKMSIFLIAELVSRRMRLLKVAQAQMSSRELDELIPKTEKDSTVPDVRAPKLIAALAERAVRIDPSLKIESPGSIYHHEFHSPTALDQLFEAGFNEVDLCDSAGRTPLMIPGVCQSLNGYSQKRIKWLLSKGADPTRKLPWNTGGTAFHLLAVCMTNLLWPSTVRAWISGTPNIREKNENPLLFTKYVLEARERDSCVCACLAGPMNYGDGDGNGDGGFGGCTPFTAALRRLLVPSPRFYTQYTTMHGVNSFAETLGFFVSMVEGTTEIAHTVIRQMTFDALDLRHTCCRKGDCYTDDTLECLDEAEVLEIRDEEQGLLEDFELLVTELTEKFEKGSLAIMDFLQGPWYRDVVEYISHLDPYDEEHVKGTRGMGLNLEIAGSMLNRTSLLVGSRIEEISDA
ncbi:hypothetical protein BDV59DRAFT_169682 [Aspergillus ambiguus]|uniref:uncharacterized protein n=1 Tax=Aspergillus ambiguus TaxID=176160 RepID=UPI003CCD9A9E